MKQLQGISGYQYASAELNASHDYLLPSVTKILAGLEPGTDKRLFELGCGNGAVAASLTSGGFDVTGIDASEDGIMAANKHYPSLKLYQGSAYDDLKSRFGSFPILLSLEVIEHVYAPRDFARTAFDLLLPGGTAIISTPYHGYVKNLALAVSGKMDDHFTALWDHGHIKFWSVRTMSTLLHEAGFQGLNFFRVGRIPMIAKSMIVVAHKPA